MTKEELELLTDSFSDSEIAAKLQITRGMVGNLRKKFEVDSYTTKTGMVKRGGIAVPTSRNYKSYTRPVLREGYVTFFDEIDTPAKAYFLGFIAADGNLDLRGRTTRIEIHHQDTALLQTFIDESKWPTSINLKPWHGKREDQASLCLSSVHLHSALCSWGITPKKSLTMQLLKPIPEDLQCHFVRGVWDGDGYISEKQFGLTSGSEVFIQQIQEMIFQNTGVKVSMRKRGENHFGLFGSKGSALAIQWIYQDAYPVLERKAIRFSRFFASF